MKEKFPVFQGSAVILFIVLSGLLILQPLPAEERGLSVIENELDAGGKIGRQWLVLIGINDYYEWTPLYGPVRDVKRIRDVLLKRYRVDRVEEIYDTDATKLAIIELFKKVIQEVKPHDSVLIFYAGHGHLDEVSGTGFWIPADGGENLDAQENWLPNSQIRGFIEKLRARHVLMFVDSCFSGDILAISRGSEPKIDNEYFQRAYDRVSRQVLTSGDIETVPDKSMFAQQLSLELDGNIDPYIDPLTLFSRIRTGIRGTMPMFGALKDSGHQEGASFLLFLNDSQNGSQNDSGPARTAHAVESGTTLENNAPAGRRSYALRSLVFPGWGQFARGDRIRGGIYVSLALPLLWSANRANSDFRTANSDYNDPVPALLLGQSSEGTLLNYFNQQRKWETLQRAETMRNVSLGMLGAFWVYNVFDAAFSTPDEGRDFSLQFFSMPGRRENSFRLNIRIPLY